MACCAVLRVKGGVTGVGSDWCSEREGRGMGEGGGGASEQHETETTRCVTLPLG